MNDGTRTKLVGFYRQLFGTLLIYINLHKDRVVI